MATKPARIGPEDWTGIKGAALETFRLMRETQLPLVASSLAYTTILSIIPVLAVSFAVFHAFGGLDRLLDTLEPFILSNLATGTGDEVTQALHNFIGNAHANAIGAGGLIGLVVTTMMMLSSAERAINKIWGVTRERSLLQRFSAYWMFITLGPMALAVAVGLATSRSAPAARFLPGGAGVFILAAAILFCIYQWVPFHPVNWRCSLFSATMTSLCWEAAGFGYKIYTKKAISYDKIYGSLSAVPTLLLWIYIMWLITLSGAALTAALHKRLKNA